VTHEAAPGATSSAEPAERRIHGMVAVGVGTGGYRQAYGQADIPLGDTGQLSIAVDESRLKGRFGRWGASGQSLAFSGAFTGGLTGGLPSDCRARGPDGVLGGGLAVAPYEAPLDAPRLGDGCRRIERTGP
jgi:hypothetical protein